MLDATGPRRLSEIVTGLHPWLRSRVCVILISSKAGGGWEAVLRYVARTLPPPPELQIAPAQAAEPSDTHHALALPSAGVEAALREQLRELADIRELGTLQVEKLPAVARPVDPQLPQPAWRITTHSGLQHQRRTWLSRIGRRDLGR
jgi:hypothetical protein